MAAREAQTECIEVEANYRTYEVNFFGTIITTTVTSTPNVINRWIYRAVNRIRDGNISSIVGMGVQWELDAGIDSAATLQLCVGRERCLIIQLNHVARVPSILRSFLLNRDHTFTGIWNNFHARRLRDCVHYLGMARRPLDLRLYLQTYDGEPLDQASFEEIVEEWLDRLGVALDREVSMSNWGADVLSDEQVDQATVRAYVAFRIGEDIQAWRLIRSRASSTIRRFG